MSEILLPAVVHLRIFSYSYQYHFMPDPWLFNINVPSVCCNSSRK